jgi:hypothetical protein
MEVAKATTPRQISFANTAKAIAATQAERETMMRFRILHAIDDLKIKNAESFEARIVVDHKTNTIMVESSDLTTKSLKDFTRALKDEPDLMALLTPMPNSGSLTEVFISHRYPAASTYVDSIRIVTGYKPTKFIEAKGTMTFAKPLTDYSHPNATIDRQLIESIAYKRTSVDQLEREARTLSPKGDSLIYTAKVRAAHKQVTEIRNAYSEYLIVEPKAEAALIGKISELETRGVPRATIKERLKKSGVVCPTH